MHLSFREGLAWARKAAPTVLLRVLVVLVGLELAYVLVANLVLMTPLLRRVVNPSDDVELDYDWAYSWVPGRVTVKNLALRMEDYNVQFFVGIERATIDVRIEKLALRRFHAVRLAAEGTTYRMRHKLHSVGQDARRVAAYPPIAGFADPPLYRGPEPPPIPDSEYALWEVKIENVSTSLREVWVLEYRYRGDGRASGSFHVKPARYYEVSHAELELSGGKLTVADVPVAEQARLAVDCRVLGSDPRSGTGAEPIRAIFANLKGALKGADLRFLNVYLEPMAGVSAAGRADTELDVALERGVLREGSRVAFETRGFAAGKGRFGVEGAPRLEISVPRGTAAPELVVEARAPRLTLTGPLGTRVEAPFVENARAGARLTRDLSRSLRVVGTSLHVPRAVVPELAWLEPLISEEESKAPRLRGEGTASLELERDARGLTGALDASVLASDLNLRPTRLAGTFTVKTRFAAAASAPQTLVFSQLRASADSARLTAGGGSPTPPWSASVSSKDTELSLEPMHARGSADVRATRTESLLPLVIDSGALREVLVAGLGLKGLTAHAIFELRPQGARIEVREARAGGVTGRGFLQTDPGNKPDARFLLSTSVANVGVRMDDGETSVKPLVSDGWLPKNAFVLPRRR